MNVLKGINVSPRVVGYARALVTAVAIAVIEAVIHFVTNNQLSDNWSVYLPVIVFVLRSLEGEIDQKQTPAQNDTPVNGSTVSVHIGGRVLANIPITMTTPSDPPAPPSAPAG